jgi:hypothetical protein
VKRLIGISKRLGRVVEFNEDWCADWIQLRGSTHRTSTKIRGRVHRSEQDQFKSQVIAEFRANGGIVAMFGELLTTTPYGCDQDTETF